MTTETEQTEHAEPPNGGDASAVAASGRAHSPWLVLAIVISGAFMQLVDVSIVNVAVPSIQTNLHASFAEVQLVVAGYQLAFACMLITSARLGDIFGRKKLFLTGMVGFTIASALCGAAPTALVLVLARILQGLMSSLMFPQVLSVIQVVFPPRARGRAFAVFGATIGLATILGPLIGGLLIAWNPAGLDWRLIFYVNLPIGVVSAVAAFLLLGESRAPRANRLDVPGAVLVTAALFLLIYPLTEGRDHGWPWWVFLMLVAAAPLLLLFGWLEVRKTRRDASPLVHTSLFHDRAFTAGTLLNLAFFAGIPAFFFTFSIYLQVGEGFSALGSGLTSFPFAIGSAFASARSDKLAKRLGRSVLSLGIVVLIAGMALILLTVHLSGTHPHAYYFSGPFLVAGLGLGLFVAPVATIVLAAVHGEAAGSASGVFSTVQQVGGALGVALIGVLFFGLLGHNATWSTRSVEGPLRQQLTAAHVPQPLRHATITAFERCFADRAHSKDPSAQPPSCRSSSSAGQASASAGPSSSAQGAAATGTGRHVGSIVASAGRTALGRDFAHSYQESLLFEFAVFVVALLLVFLLPPIRGADVGAPPAAPAA